MWVLWVLRERRLTGRPRCSPWKIITARGRVRGHPRRTRAPRAGALIGRVLAVSDGIRKAIDTWPYPPVSTYRRLPGRPVGGRRGPWSRGDGGGEGEGGGGRRERSHCKLTVIAFNVTRVYGRIKVNCSKWRSMRPKKRSQLAFVYSCDRREKSTIRKLQKRAFFRIDDKKKKMERWHSIDLTLFFTHHYYLRLWRQKRKNT